MAFDNPMRSLLEHARERIDEHIPGYQSLDAMHGYLSKILCDISAALQATPGITLSCEEKANLWHIINKLWNWCAGGKNAAAEVPLYVTATTQPTSELLALGEESIYLNDKLCIGKLSTVFDIYHKVLRLLSQAYLVSGQAAHALTCVQNVRKLKQPPGDVPELCLTALEALIQLDQPQTADAELLALVLHKDAPAALCVAALSAAIQVPRCSALKPAADIVLQRFAEDATVPLRMVEALLETSKRERVSQDRESLVLGIAGNKKVLVLIRKETDSTRDQRKSMYTLLWNYAVQRYASNDYRAYDEFYAAALCYAEADAEAALVRQLGLLNHDVDRFQRSRDTPEHITFSSLITTPQGTTELLAQREVRKALDQMRLLMNTNSTSMDLLRALGPERAPNLGVAKHYIRMLWNDAIARQSPSERPGDDWTLVFNLFLTIIGGHLSCTAAAESGEGSSIDIWTATNLNELSELYNQVESRLEAVGRDSFFGSGPCEDADARRFAIGAFGIGAIALRKSQDLTAAATLFKAGGSLLKAFPCTTPEHWSLLQEAIVQSIHCAVDEFANQLRSKAVLRLLQILHKHALPALKAAMQLPMDPKELLKAKKAVWSLEFNLAMEQGRYGQLLPLMEQAKKEGLWKARGMLQFSYICLRNPSCGAPAARVAFSAALQLARSQKDPLPMDKVAVAAVEELYEASSEEEKLGLLADVGAFVRSMDTPSYPKDEMNWLIDTTWAIGIKHAQARRNPQALSFMAAAIDLMDLSDDFRDEKKMFERDMKKLQKKSGKAGAAVT